MSINNRTVPFFGVRKFAAKLLEELDTVLRQRNEAQTQLRNLGGLTLLEIAERKKRAENEISIHLERVESLKKELESTRQQIVATEDLAILQEAGVYAYFHPLSDAVAYQTRLADIQERIKAMNRKDGGAIRSTTSWTVNGSEAQGRSMVRDISKLMLRAFNAEADNLVRGLKPYKVHSAIERSEKVATTIEKLGKTMQIRIASSYLYFT